MVSISLKDRFLSVSLYSGGPSTFTECVHVLKQHRFRYSTKTHEWIGPWFKLNELKEDLEDVDTIEMKIDEGKLEELASGPQEQFRESERRVPDWGLMNYGPMTGKHPYEMFQKRAITKGINFSSYCYFYGPGSGKSYVFSAITAHRLYKYGDCSKVLLLTTNIGVRNLYHEILKFIKGLDPEKVRIADKNYRNPFDDPNTDIVITSYNSFRLVCDYYRKKAGISSKNPRKPFLPLQEWFGENGRGMIALDESHCVANPSSQQGHLIALHAPLFTYRYLFSGTPADNPEKLYNQYNIVDPYLVYGLSFAQWKEKMAYLGTRYSMYAVREWKKDALEEQNQRFLRSYGEYFRTTDLVDLPDYYEKNIYIPMSREHRRIYESVIVQDLDGRNSVKDVVNRFPYMMLGTDDPSLLRKHLEKFDTDLGILIDRFNPKCLEKYNALQDIIDDNPGEKIIVWVVHPTTAYRICERFSKLNPICIVGDTPMDERFGMVEEFKKGDHSLLVAVIQTLSTSITITESKISVYFERDFNYTNYSQSQARNYRLGQKDDVVQYNLLYDRSLDCLSYRNLQNKGTLVSGLCSRDFLTQDEWIRIFNFSEDTQIDI